MKADEAFKALNPLIPQIKKLYSEIDSSHQDNIARAVRLGELLNQAKDGLGRGNFVGWLAAHMKHISDRTAYMFIQVFKISQSQEFSIAQRAAQLPASIRGVVSAFSPKKPRSKRKKKDSPPPLTQSPGENGETLPTSDEGAEHPVILDRLKNPVPPHICESWIDATVELQDLLKTIKGLADDLNEMLTSASPAGAYLSVQSVASRLKEAAAAIREAQPYAVCPYCQAHQKAMKTCAVCGIDDLRLGWVNKRTYERGAEALKTA